MSIFKKNKTTTDGHTWSETLKYIDHAAIICDGLRVVESNPSFLELVGLQSDQIMLSELFAQTEIIRKLCDQEDLLIETELQCYNRESIPVRVKAVSITYNSIRCRLLKFSNLSAKIKSEQTIEFLSHHDPLTKLPNREQLKVHLNEITKKSLRAQNPCSVYWIDIEKFSAVNEKYGTDVGDKILLDITEILRDKMTLDTFVARVDGDEFIMVCSDLTDILEARLIGQYLRRQLNKTYTIQNHSIPISISIGVSVYPQDAKSSDDLLRFAKLALEQAKNKDAKKIKLYSKNISEQIERTNLLGDQLEQAILNHDIKVYFQPFTFTHNRKPSGFEALVRWQHPELGVIPPPDFLEIADDRGLMMMLTEYVMANAIATAKTWPEHMRVGVNVSPEQLTPVLVDMVRDLLKVHDFAPERLEIEVTEDALIKDFTQASNIFARLRTLGIQVAMDDFGTGYTSFTNLRYLHFDRIKIDRIFTIDLPNHRRVEAVVKAMLVLAQELGIDVTIEGVETEEQFAFLTELGAKEVQGFLFSPPKPVEALHDMIYDETAQQTETDDNEVVLQKRA